MRANNMQKGQVPTIVLAGILILAIVAAGAYYLGTKRTETPSTAPQSTSKSSPDTLPTNTNETAKATPKAETDELRTCITDKEKEIKDHKINAGGSLIVAFKTATKEEAHKIINLYGLDIVTESLDFEVNKWLVIEVPNQKGLEWMCKLEDDPKIKSVVFDSPVGF